MVGTNLTQAEVEGLEAASFRIDSRECFDKMHERILARSENTPPLPVAPKGSGDMRPKMRDSRPFHFVAEPSPQSIVRRWLLPRTLNVRS